MLDNYNVICLVDVEGSCQTIVGLIGSIMNMIMMMIIRSVV